MTEPQHGASDFASEARDSLDSEQFNVNPAFSSTQNIDDDVSHKVSKIGRLTLLPTIIQPTKEFESNNSSADETLIPLDQGSSLSNTQEHSSKHDCSPQSNLASRFANLKLDDVNEKSYFNDDQQIGEDSFDVFILKHFTQYTGREDVTQWLDDTEEKFKKFDIGRHARFAAISFLVASEAKRRYIRCRASIRSFDDFYAFMLTEFDSSSISSSSAATHHVRFTNDTLPERNSHTSITSPHKQLSTDFMSDTFDPLFSSVTTSVVQSDVAAPIHSKSAINSTISSQASSNFELDQTLTDLRKAIVGDFIKNPKVFKGGKDDVKKWIENIEHLFDLAHLPESIRLDLISYSLRGDALDWFKNNRSSFTSWTLFVTELKRAFTSSFHEELAFKKLESYSQTENQSIRNFVNEVLKLCKEADPTMSEATKLKNLLNKTKPSIQYEVRKKKPQSTSEFLEFAKEAEELMQLSNLPFPSALGVPHDSFAQSTSTSIVPSYSASQHNYGYTSSRNSNNRNQGSTRRNFSPQQRNFPSQSRNLSNSSVPASQSRSTPNPIFSQQSLPRNLVPISTTSNPPRPLMTHSNANNTMPLRQPTVNVIDLAQSIDHIDLISNELPSVLCSRYPETSIDGVVSGRVFSNPSKSSLIYFTAYVNQLSTPILLDTGATTTFIHKHLLEQFPHYKMIDSTHSSFVLADGVAPFHVLGTVFLTLQFAHMMTTVTAQIADNLCTNMILGMDYINQYNLSFNVARQTISIEYDSQIATIRMDTEHTVSNDNRLGYINCGDTSCFFPIIFPTTSISFDAISIPDTRTDSLCYPPNVSADSSSHGSTISFAPYHHSFPSTQSFTCNAINALPESVVKSIDQLVQSIDDPSGRDQLYRLLIKFSSSFDVRTHNIANTSIHHVIHTVPHSPPACKPYPQPDKDHTLYDLIQEFLQAGLISESHSPYAAPAMLVKKKDGTHRFVVDYKRLNLVTIKDSSPLPNMEETLRRLGTGYRYFSKLDLKSGFYQIPIRDEDKAKTAFVTSFGLFQYNVLPMGLKNSPPTFQKVMTDTLKSCRSFSSVYLDDIIIFSKSFEEHLAHLERVLIALQAKNLVLNPPKCVFAAQEIDYLGHTVSQYGLKPLQERIDTILALKEPKTLAQANKFIGSLSWYRKFIPDFATVAAPIHAVTNLTKTNRHKFHWRYAQSQAFTTLKQMLVSTPLFLHFPVDDVPVMLTTDA
ncbi:unnamed protein product, partial [Adineta ricciae]